MVDIVIRGISLPEGELKYVTLWVYGDGRVYVSNSASAASSQRLQDLAVPLPEGHGRLIDGHKLYRALFATECGNIAADRDSEGWPKVLTYEAVKKAIQDATIIVPAEGDEADGNS